MIVSIKDWTPKCAIFECPAAKPSSRLMWGFNAKKDVFVSIEFQISSLVFRHDVGYQKFTETFGFILELLGPSFQFHELFSAGH